MKKRYSKKHSSKLNIFLVIAALLALVITAITVSYSWIESSNMLNINNKGGAEGHKISVNVPNPGVVKIDRSKPNSVSLNDYIDNSNSLFLAPAKIDASGNLTIKRASGDYTPATTNDIGNNYIEFDVPFTVAGRYKFSFTADSAISVAESTSNPIRTSLKVDDRKAIIFDSFLNKVGTSDKSAFSVQAGSHTLKVRIWLDASTTENETAAENFKGSPVDISLNLVAEDDTSLRKVTISESTHAIVTATYNNGTDDVTLNEGQFAQLEPGTELTVTVKTADGIVKDEYSALNGYMFKNISEVVGGTSAVLTNEVGSTDDTHIATTTYIYTVPDDGKTDDIAINTDTERETFYIIGPGIQENSDWDNQKQTTLSNYDSVNNCVYGVFTAVDTGGEFKISEKTDNGGTNVGRDSPKYSVSLNSPTVIKSGNITEATLNGQPSPNTNFTYTTSSSGGKILVIYYLSDNTVEIASGDTYVAEYTATARVSTANSNGTATVTYSGTTSNTVNVPRRADNKAVTFKAEPIAGYTFVGWSTSDPGTTYESTKAEYTTTLTGDLILYANFRQGYSVKVKAAEGATLSASYTDIYGAPQTATNIISDTTIDNVLVGSTVEITATQTYEEGKSKFTWSDASKNIGVPDPEASEYTDTSKYTISSIADDADISVTLEHYYALKVNLEGTGSYTVDSGEAQTATSTTYIKAGVSSKITAIRTVTDPYKVSWTATGSQTDSQSAELIGSTNTNTYTVSKIGADTTVTIKFERMYTLEVTKTGGDEVDTDLFKISPKVGDTPLTANEDGKYYVVSGTSVDFDFTPTAPGNYSYTWTVTIGSAPYTSGTTPSSVNVTDNTTVALNIAKLTYREVTVKSADYAIVSASYKSLNDSESTIINLNEVTGIPIGATITVIAKTADGIVTGAENSALNAHRFAMFNEIIGDNTIQLTGNIENSHSGTGNDATDNFETNKLTYTVTGNSTEPITLETMTVNETLYVDGKVNPPGGWHDTTPDSPAKMTYVAEENYYYFTAKATGTDNNEFKISLMGVENDYKDKKRYSLSYSATKTGDLDLKNSTESSINEYNNFIFTAGSGTDVVIRYYPATNTVDVSNKTYTVTASAGTGGSATVSLNGGAATSSVTIDRSSTTAPELVFSATTSSANYQFDNWTDSNNNLVSTDNPYTTTGITSTDTITANFKGVDRNVYVEVVENADIEVVSPSITEGNSATVEHGKTITISASYIDSQYAVTKFIIKDSRGNELAQLTPTGNSATYMVQSDIQISATLEEKAETRTVYFKNSRSWGNPSVYTWTGSTPYTGSYPGTAMTSIGNDIYSYEIPLDAQNIIFNDGTSGGSKTMNLVIPGDSYLFVLNTDTNKNDGVWLEYSKYSTSTTPFANLMGGTGDTKDWTTGRPFYATSDPNVGEIIVALEANSTLEFKITSSDRRTWYKHNVEFTDNTITDSCTNLDFSSTAGGNCKFNATTAGNYKFTFTSEKKLTIQKVS